MELAVAFGYFAGALTLNLALGVLGGGHGRTAAVAVSAVGVFCRVTVV